MKTLCLTWLLAGVCALTLVCGAEPASKSEFPQTPVVNAPSQQASATNPTPPGC